MMDEKSERRSDYPNILQMLSDISSEQSRIESILKNHLEETKEFHKLWEHSVWMIKAIKWFCIFATSLLTGWLAMKQFFWGH